LEPLIEHILRLRMSAQPFSPRGDEEDVQVAWRLAAARHHRSIARRIAPAPGSQEVEDPEGEVAAHIDMLNRLIDDQRGPHGGSRPAEDGG